MRYRIIWHDAGWLIIRQSGDYRRVSLPPPRMDQSEVNAMSDKQVNQLISRMGKRWIKG